MVWLPIIACRFRIPTRGIGQALWLGYALALGAVPLAAQQTATDAELQALIPDSALAHPEDWAKTLPPPPPAPAAGQEPSPEQYARALAASTALSPVAPLNPASPMSDLAGFSLAWPSARLDLPQLAALPPDADALPQLNMPQSNMPQMAVAPAPGQPAAVKDTASDHRTGSGGRTQLVWPDGASFPEKSQFEARFRELVGATPQTGKGEDALATLAVRAASGRAVLEKLLKTYGYYEGEVIQSLGDIAPGEGAAATGGNLRYEIVPGTRFRFGVVDLGQLADTGGDYPALRKSFAINPGDPLHADAIPAATSQLATALGEAGYPFAKLGEPSLLVDHRREEGDLALPVAPGGKYRFGAINSSAPRFLSNRHLAKIARFKPGQPYRAGEVEDLRRAILATGLVSSLAITPREVHAPRATDLGEVALDVGMTRAPLHTLAGEVGYDTGEGWRLEASWEHRNLFPPEGLLRVRGIAGTNEQLAGLTFRRNNFGGRDRVLTVDLYADNATLTAYAARKLAFAASFERQTTLLFQKPWVWSLGVETEYSAEREGMTSGITTGRTTYTTVALPLRGAFDGSDDLLDPTRGFRVSLRISPEVAKARGQVATYARILGDASYYLPVGKQVVLAGRVRLGTMPGTALADIAPSRRFYAGGGGSIRGYGYELVGPRNALGDPQGGRSLYEFSAEARVHTGLFGGALALVPFFDAGGADTSPLIGFRDMRYGAGLGFRYQTGFGPIRLDIGTPLNPRAGDSRIGVYVALGQSF